MDRKNNLMGLKFIFRLFLKMPSYFVVRLVRQWTLFRPWSTENFKITIFFYKIRLSKSGFSRICYSENILNNHIIIILPQKYHGKNVRAY